MGVADRRDEFDCEQDAQSRYIADDQKCERLAHVCLQGSIIPTRLNHPSIQQRHFMNNQNVSAWASDGGIQYIGKEQHFYPPAPAKSVGIPHNLPYGSSNFVGRDADLERLHLLVQRETTVPISLISGMGGLGKTELALQYAYRHLKSETYRGGICWLRAGEKQDLGTQIVLFARTNLDLSPPDDLELDDKVRWCWRHWREGDVLVIFDDVWNYDSDTEPDRKYPKVELVLPPVEPRFRVVLTTRLKLLDSDYRLELEVLTEAAALELLRSLVTDGRIDQQLDVAKRVCEWLGYLPLGLELVGRYLAQSPDTSLAKLEQRLQERRLQAHALKDASRNIVAVFELSWETLDEFGRELAGLLSLFALAEIPWRLVEQCLSDWDEEDLEGVRDKQLLRGHLLQRTGVEMYQLHQLLREFFAVKREQMAKDVALKQTVCQAMASVAKQMPTEPTLQQIEQFTPDIPHLKEVATTLCSWLTDTDLIFPSIRVAQFYEGQAVYESALPWYQHCLETAEVRLGKNHTDVATSLDNLGDFYRIVGRYAEAKPLFQRAIAIKEQHLGADHLDVAISINNLALLYHAQGQYAKAEVYCQQALSIREQKLGSKHLDVTVSLNNLALVYSSQGRYAEAEPLYQRSLAISEQHLGSDHLYVAVSLNNLALLYVSQGRYTEAESLYQRSLTIREQQLGNDHPSVANSLNNLVGLYYQQRRYTKAEPLCQRSLDILEQKLGSDHPNVAKSLNSLASLYDSQGRYTEAEPLYQRSLVIREQQLGNDHPDVATSLNNLAGFYESQGRYAEAEPLYQRSLAIWEQKLGSDHPNVATSLNGLASLYYEQKRYTDAELLYRRSLSIWEQKLGSDHPDVATSLNNLASVYVLQERYTEAEPLYVRSLSIWEQQFGQDHPNVAANLDNLVALYEELTELYESQGHYAEAESCYQRLLAIRERQLGSDHPDVVAYLSNLAAFYKLQGRYGEAEPLYIRAITILGSQVGANHPNTQTCKQNFLSLLNQVFASGQTAQLSDHPLTQAVLQQLQTENGNT